MVRKDDQKNSTDALTKPTGRVDVTKKFVDRLIPPASGQVIYRDKKLIGFGVRLTSGSAVFIAEGRVKGSGKVRRIVVGRIGKTPVDEAREKAREELYKMSVGVDQSAVKELEKTKAITLRQALEEYITSRGNNLKDKTIKDYRKCANACLKPWLDRPLIEITEKMVTERHTALVKPDLKMNCRAFANMSMTVLKIVYNFAATQYTDQAGAPIFGANPVKILSRQKRWHKVERRKDAIRADRLPALAQAFGQVADKRQVDYFLFLLFTGMRKQEAYLLRWKYVSLQLGTIDVPGEITKTGTSFILPINTHVRTILERLKKDQEDAGRELDWVFVSNRDPSTHLRDSMLAIRIIRTASGIEEFHPHCLRGSFITYASELVPFVHAKRLVNHAMSGVTEGYTVSGIGALRNSSQVIGDFIVEQMSAAVPETSPV